MQGRSKKAFSKNVETEMEHGKPMKQSLAIAYDVKRKNSKRKKMAKGGMEMNETSVRPDKGYGKIIMINDHDDDKHQMAEGGEISASNERRPMPDNTYDDAKMASENRNKKALKDSQWTDRPTERQAIMNNGRKVMPIARPKMVPSNVFSTRLYDEEARLQSAASPGPYGEQPPREDDEMGSDRQGPSVPALKMKKMADGGQVKQNADKIMERNIKRSNDPELAKKHQKYFLDAGRSLPKKKLAEGGMLKRDESDLMDYEDPSEDEGAANARSRNEEDPDRQGPIVSDMEDEHSTGRKPYAHGGDIQYEDAMDHIDHDTEMNPAHGLYSNDDSEDQPMDEAEEEHHDSIASAIMAREERQMHLKSDSDMDKELMMAEGGDILSHDSIYSDDSDMVDLSRNHDEDANEEDQLSFNALRKENYNDSNLHVDQPEDSNEHGDSEEHNAEDHLDMIDKIMSRMKSKKSR